MSDPHDLFITGDHQKSPVWQETPWKITGSQPLRGPHFSFACQGDLEPDFGPLGYPRLTLGSRQWVGWRLPANCRSTGHLASESRQQESAESAYLLLDMAICKGFLLFNDGGVFNFDPCQHSQINYIKKLQEARPSQALRLELVSLICQNFSRDCGQHKSWQRSLRWSLVI